MAQLEHWVATRPPKWTGLPVRWFRQQRHVRGMRAQGLKPVGFVTVLKHVWGLDSGWQIPAYHLRKAWRRVLVDIKRLQARSAAHASGR